MSRYLLDDARDDRTAPGPGPERERQHAPEREPEAEAETRAGRGSSPTELLNRHLDLDRVEWRDLDEERDRTADHGGLDRADLETLATIGAFRVVATEDLKTSSEGRDGDLRRLSDQGLVTRETLTDRSGSRHIVSLTSSGKALVEAHRHSGGPERPQAIHADAVKPRELAHDGAQSVSLSKPRTPIVSGITSAVSHSGARMDVSTEACFAVIESPC